MIPFTELVLAPILIGLTHSLETDHIVAVGNLVSIKKSWKNEGIRGITWGLGHTISVALGTLAIGLIKDTIFPESTWSFEILVGIMMVAIGIAKLYQLQNPRKEKREKGNYVFFQVGLVHGLAGSGAVAALLAGRMNDPVSQLLFLLLFGLGTMVGMGIITALLTQLKIFKSTVTTSITGLIAIVSLLYGLKIIYEQSFMNLN